jgi:hypothetical protein
MLGGSYICTDSKLMYRSFSHSVVHELDVPMSDNSRCAVVAADKVNCARRTLRLF